MYIVTDFTRSTPCHIESCDGKDVADIIIGITGSEEVAKKALLEIYNMGFGDTLDGKPYFEVKCVDEDDSVK